MHKSKVCDVAFSIYFHTQHYLSVINTLTIQDISFHLSAFAERLSYDLNPY